MGIFTPRRARRRAPLSLRWCAERLEQRRLLSLSAGVSNCPPELNFISDRFAEVGTELTLTMSATDPESNPIGFRLDPDETPAGATVDRQTGAFRWTPTEPGEFRIVAMAIDQGTRPLMDAQVFHVTVLAPHVNEAPVNTVPAAVNAVEDTTLNFTGASAVSIADADAGGADVEVALIATHGDLSLASVAGLSFVVGDGAQDSTMTFRGSITAINAALGGLSYRPELNYNGAAALTVTTNDLGATGTGGAQSDTDEVAITVTAVNDSPSFVKGADIAVDEDSGAASPAWATAISPGPTDEAGQSVSFLVTADKPELFSVQPAVGSDGVLTFTPAANAFGTAIVSVRAQDTGGVANGGVNTSAVQTFNLTINPLNDAPVLPTLADRAGNVDVPVNFVVTAADPDNDTLSYQIPFIEAQPAGGNLTPDAIIIDTGEFSFTPAVAGTYTFLVSVVDSANPAGADTRSQTIIVDASAASVLPPAFELSDGSNPITSQSTLAAKVTLTGHTSPGATVTLLSSGAAALASASGDFYLPNVPLAPGNNTLTLRAKLGGQQADFQRVIQRQDGAVSDEPVVAWDRAMLTAISLASLPPPVASRAMAIVSASVLDAVSAIEGTPAMFVDVAAPVGANVQAAVIGAAHRALSSLIASQQAAFDALRTSQLAALPDNQAVADGLAVGQAMADGMLQTRASDGSTTAVTYTPGTDPGDWQPTPPANAPALLPQWASLAPFTMSTSSQFLPPGPPELTGAAWAAAFNEVKDLGSATSATRTADQTQIARYWADGSGTYTPPGHWNDIAADLAVAANQSTSTNARLFAQLNLAVADAAIVAWNAKYTYNTWRPITAIRNADSANNPGVTADAAWTPLLTTPPFPEYTSGHSTFSAAAGTILSAQFGASTPFSSTSDFVTEGGSPVTRSFANFDAAVDEAGKSRVFGGIHFEFANADGQTSGRSLGNLVLASFNTASDTFAPRVFVTSHAPGLSTDQNLVLAGHAVDNLSGLQTLTARLDAGAPQALTVGPLGQFSFATTLPLDGTATGPHTVTFEALDVAGNARSLAFAFTLTAPPAPPPAAASSLASSSASGSGAGSGSAAAVDAAMANLGWLTLAARGYSSGDLWDGDLDD